MLELMIDFITSLDGYGAAEGWPGWWGREGPEYLAWLGDQPEAGYTVLMGANTYRLMSELATGGEPGTDELAGLSNVVFSTTLEEPLAWPNTELVSRDAVESVREMKERGIAPMRTLGSLTLCAHDLPSWRLPSEAAVALGRARSMRPQAAHLGRHEASMR
jgi:dihydrofolate reductase